MDKIRIKNLKIRANHGVFAAEKELGQNFYISTTIYGDFNESIWHEDLEKSVHYGLLAQHIATEFKKRSYDLIETAGYQIGWSILGYSSLIKKVTIEIKKPEAPIDLALETVSFKTTLKKSKAYVAIGSNIGDSNSYFEQAITKINAIKTTKITNQSQRIITEPYGGVEQNNFLNAVLEIETCLKPQQLLTKLQEIEISLGRTREIKWGPRTIDLDILYFDTDIIYTDNLVIPHPEIQKRKFVLESLIELIPNYIHPRLMQTNQELFDKIK